MPIDYKLIGKNIRNARLALDMTQQALADKTELSINHISHVEIGSSPVSLPALLKICEVLGTTPDRLLYENLSQPTAYMNVDIAECFADVTPKESSVMLAVAKSARDAMRTVNAISN